MGTNPSGRQAVEIAPDEFGERRMARFDPGTILLPFGLRRSFLRTVDDRAPVASGAPNHNEPRFLALG